MIDGVKKRLWIAGLGNVLMRDDGVGAVAAQRLSQYPPEDACVSEVGTAIMSYADLICWADTIIFIDALQSGKTPGAVSVLAMDELDSRSGRLSAHNLNFFDAIRLFRPDAPPRVKLVGVEPEIIDYGLHLSAPVAKAIPEVLATVRRTAALFASAESTCGKAA